MTCVGSRTMGEIIYPLHGFCRRTGKCKPEAAELAAYFEILSRLEGNNATLCALGEPPLNTAVPRSPGDMDSEELRAQIERIDGLIGHQQQKLDVWQAAAAARRESANYLQP
jgi:hypothetical protein